MVVIRSPWDYHLRPAEFLEVVKGIAESTRLENQLELVRWNASKTYLKDLDRAGVPTVPTEWLDRPPISLEGLSQQYGWEEVIVKPVVSASAYGTFRLHRDDTSGWMEAKRFFENRPLMTQPLVESVLTEGEYSVFYFDGDYSHTVLKTAGGGDYRVQEEYGGTTVPSEPTQELRSAADRAMAALEQTPLYARVDLARAPDETGYWLMELELIEPVLYLGKDLDAPGRFARGLDRRSR